jgi:hypothetical protein
MRAYKAAHKVKTGQYLKMKEAANGGGLDVRLRGVQSFNLILLDQKP